MSKRLTLPDIHKKGKKLAAFLTRSLNECQHETPYAWYLLDDTILTIVATILGLIESSDDPDERYRSYWANIKNELKRSDASQIIEAMDTSEKAIYLAAIAVGKAREISVEQPAITYTVHQLHDMCLHHIGKEASAEESGISASDIRDMIHHEIAYLVMKTDGIRTPAFRQLLSKILSKKNELMRKVAHELSSSSGLTLQSLENAIQTSFRKSHFIASSPLVPMTEVAIPALSPMSGGQPGLDPYAIPPAPPIPPESEIPYIPPPGRLSLQSKRQGGAAGSAPGAAPPPPTQFQPPTINVGTPAALLPPPAPKEPDKPDSTYCIERFITEINAFNQQAAPLPLFAAGLGTLIGMCGGFIVGGIIGAGVSATAGYFLAQAASENSRARNIERTQSDQLYIIDKEWRYRLSTGQTVPLPSLPSHSVEIITPNAVGPARLGSQPDDPNTVISYGTDGAISLSIDEKGWYVSVQPHAIDALLKATHSESLEHFHRTYGDGTFHYEAGATGRHRLNIADPHVTELMLLFDKAYPLTSLNPKTKGLVGEDEEWMETPPSLDEEALEKRRRKRKSRQTN